MEAPKILIIDDDPELLALNQEGFSSCGYEVTTTTTGFEAIRHMASQKYNAIITDYVMPEMDGIQLANYVKANEMNALTPVFVLSGNFNEAVCNKFSHIGVIDLIRKPFNLMDLVKKVDIRINRFSKANEYADSLKDIFKNSIKDVFSYYGDVIELGNDYIITSKSSIAEFSSVIPFFGSNLSGYVSVYASKGFMQKVCNFAFNTTGENFSDEIYLDMCSEVNNQILGDLKSVMLNEGLPLLLGLPLTYINAKTSLSLVPSSPRQAIEINCSGEQGVVEFSVVDPRKVAYNEKVKTFPIFKYEGE